MDTLSVLHLRIFVKMQVPDDRVNLLSVGESQRVPALDLSRLDFLKFTLSIIQLRMDYFLIYLYNVIRHSF